VVIALELRPRVLRLEFSVRELKAVEPPMTPFKLIVPAPAKVKALAPLIRFKLRVSVALVESIVLRPASVILPLTVFVVPETVARAPAALTPVPLSAKVLPLVRLTPLRSNSLPKLTVIPTVPKPLLFETLTIPELIVVPPE
jgi:hypothetical protein